MTLVLGFCLRLSKFIQLIVSLVYGVAAGTIFGFARFGIMRIIADKISDTFLSNYSFVIWYLVNQGISISVPKLLSYLYSIAFMMAFITAILICIASVIFMILGNAKRNIQSDFDFNGNYDMPPVQPISPVQSVPPVQPIPPVQPMPPVQPVPTEQPSIQSAPASQSMGQVKCTKGVASGQGYMLPPDRKVVVGKSPQSANLVINNPKVSNIHCSIRYNAASNTYIVKDHSTNGTFVSGVQLQSNVAIQLPAGTVLSLADGTDEVMLG